MLPGWLNENSYRDYPFQPGADITQDAIADMGVILGPFLDQGGFSNSNMTSSFDAATVDVKLSSVSTVGSSVIYTFDLTSTNVASHLVFSCPLTDPPFKTYFANAYVGHNLMWQGFLVTGFGANLRDRLSNGNFNCNQTKLEKACVQNLSKRFVSSLNLANYPRLTISTPAGCPGNTDNPSIPTDHTTSADEEVSLSGDVVSINGQLLVQAVVNAVGITGNVRFKEGYNCALRQEASTKSLVISAATNAGEGPACEEVPISQEEQNNILLGTPLGLTGGPTCHNVLLSLNGITGENILISAGAGFQVKPSETDAHTIIISAVPGAFAACLG